MVVKSASEKYIYLYTETKRIPRKLKKLSIKISIKFFIINKKYLIQSLATKSNKRIYFLYEIKK